MLPNAKRMSGHDIDPQASQQTPLSPYKHASISQNMTSLPVIHELATAQPPIPLHSQEGGKGYPSDSIFERIEEWLISQGIRLEEPTESQDAYYSFKKAEVTEIRKKSNSFTPTLEMGSLSKNLTFNSLYLRRKQKNSMKKRANSGEAGPDALRIERAETTKLNAEDCCRQKEPNPNLKAVQRSGNKLGPNGITLSTMDSLLGIPMTHTLEVENQNEALEL